MSTLFAVVIVVVGFVLCGLILDDVVVVGGSVPAVGMESRCFVVDRE